MPSLLKAARPPMDAQHKEWLNVIRGALRTHPIGWEAQGHLRAILLVLSQYMDPPAAVDPRTTPFIISQGGTAGFFSVGGRHLKHKDLLAKKFEQPPGISNTHVWLRAKRREVDTLLQNAELSPAVAQRVQSLYFGIERLYMPPRVLSAELEEAFRLGRVVEILSEAQWQA